MSLTSDVLLQQISDDRSLAAALLFPHRHPQQSPAFHVNVTDLWRCADEFVVVQAFREGAKTTLSEEFELIEGLFGNFKYLLIFGETYTKACQRIESMKHELNTNLKIATLFGQMRGDKWSENKIILRNGVCIEAHGWEEEIRGYLYLGNRPDRVYLDDIETEESVRDTATVDKNWKKLHKQLLPAMDKVNGKLRMTGTPLADDCMITRAAQSKRWASGFFPICDGEIDNPDTQSLWAERYPMEWIRKTRDHFSEEGMLREFMQEYMLVPSGAQGKPFDESMITTCDLPPAQFAPRVTIIDPARTVEVKTSDQTGHVTVSRIGTRLYVHESGGEYWQPDEIVQGAFDISRRNEDAEVAIEKNSLDNWLLQPIRAKMLLTGQSISLKVLTAPQDRNKAAFIMGLRPFFIAGDIILVGGKAKHQKLVSQILNFPAGKRDILNALAYAPKVFSGQPVYGDFGQSNIIDRYELGKNAVLLLGVNATSSETAGVLCAVDGQYLTVLADWVSPLIPMDAIPDIAMLLKAAYPGKPVTAWLPADSFDQVGRNPLVQALQTARLTPNRAEHTEMSRGSLSPMIRTEMRGTRMFKVMDTATNTLHAMAMGYNWPVRPNGERAGDPEKNQSRTLMEAIEVLTSALNKVNNTDNIAKPNAHNSLGVPYISALSR